MKECVGVHLLVELVGCDPERIRFIEAVEPVLLEAVRESGASYIGHTFHQFQPEGVTGVVLISESHFGLHTWPEFKYASFDILTCGKKMNPYAAIEIVANGFKASQTIVKEFPRGY